MGSLKDFDSHNKGLRLHKDLFSWSIFVFLFYLGLLSTGIHLFVRGIWKQTVPKDGVRTWSLLPHDQMLRISPSNSNRLRRDGVLSDSSIILSPINFWGFSKSFICLLKSAIIAWEFIVVQIALCKSPFNVTFFSFHRTGMSHQKGRLKFHYQGGFGHELKVKTWQHQAKMRTQNN